MRTHLDAASSKARAERIEKRLLVFGMKSLTVLQIVFLFFSGAFAFKYVALASARNSHVNVRSPKSQRLVGPNDTDTGANSTSENAIDADGHEQVVKSISSLLSESLNKSIGHFKYIQEVVEDSNKVNLSSLAFDKNTSPKVSTVSPVSKQTSGPNSSPMSPPPSFSPTSDKPPKINEKDDESLANLPVTSYAFDHRRHEVTTTLPLITIDFEKESGASHSGSSKKEAARSNRIKKPSNSSTSTRSPATKPSRTRQKVRNQVYSYRYLNVSKLDKGQDSLRESSEKSESTFPFGARFLNESFQPNGSKSESINVAQLTPISLDGKNQSSDPKSGVICVELVDGQVKHPNFHKEVFPELQTPSFIMPTMPRIPMSYETYLSYNLTNFNYTRPQVTSESGFREGRDEWEKLKFYANQYRPINLDYLREEKKKEESETDADEDEDKDGPVYRKEFDPKSGYIPLSSKLSFDDLEKLKALQGSSSNVDENGESFKAQAFVRPGPGIVIPVKDSSPPLSSASKPKANKKVNSPSHKKPQPQLSRPPLHRFKYTIDSTSESDPDEIPISFPPHSVFSPTQLGSPPILGLSEGLTDPKNIAELLSSHNFFNHDLTMSPMSEMVENRPTEVYLPNIKSESSTHTLKDTINHYNSLNTPASGHYKYSNYNQGILYYEPQFAFNPDPALISPYLALEPNNRQKKPKKTSKRTKSRRTQTSSRKPRLMNQVTPEDYAPHHIPYSRAPIPMFSSANYLSLAAGNGLMYRPTHSLYQLTGATDEQLAARSDRKKSRRNNGSRRRGSRKSNQESSIAESIQFLRSCPPSSFNCNDQRGFTLNGKKAVKFELKDALS